MLKQPTICELKYFVTAVSNLYRTKQKDISPQLVRSSLNLLKDLPAARDAVFEYFVIVFDVSVEKFSKDFKDNIDMLNKQNDDECINEIQEALENLVTNGPQSWSPLISTWSLRLLGKLSSKHAPRSNKDIGTVCNFWLDSNTIRCLLGLTALCFGKLSNDETEICIGVMLGIFVQYSPCFDWVVARLGSCFPMQVISKILQCGLKGFSGNSNSTLDSEVGILGYLAFSHEKELKCALMEMLQNLFNPSTKIPTNLNLIPYLLHLCRMSDILLQPIVAVFLEIFDDNLISKFSFQSYWPQNYNLRELLSLLTDLSIKIQNNGTNILLKWSVIAGKYPWCHELLEYVLYELEKLNLQGQSTPLLRDILKSESKEALWNSCCSTNSTENSTAVRMILLVSNKRFPLVYHQTISELLGKSSSLNLNSLGCLIRILGGPNGTVDIPEVTPGLELALEVFFMENKRRQKENSITGLNILKNLVYIVRTEKKGICPNLKKKPITKACQQCLSKLLNIFQLQLDKITVDLEVAKSYMDKNTATFIKPCNPVSKINDLSSKKIKTETEEEGIIEDEEEGTSENNYDNNIEIMDIIKNQVHIMVKLLDCLEIIGKENCLFDVADILKLSKLLVKYFFLNLTEVNPITRLNAMNSINSLLERHCQNKIGRAAALVDLLDGALYKYSNLFGSENYSTQKKGVKNDLLISLNQKLGATTNTNRSILHAGIIGQGLRETKTAAKLPSIEIQKLLLSALTAACKEDIPANITQGFSTISSILVELVSPDVMYNGVAWFDEEFSKITMERDLQIRRTFKNSPILWTILEHVATQRSALCNASVLFRALCASVLHQWQAKSVEKTSNLLNSDLMFVTKKIIEIMGLAQFLPPPFSYFHFVIEFFDPTEIAVVLKECIWVFMKENVPSTAAYVKEPITGFQFRDLSKLKPCIKDDILRNMMERKLPQLGHYYYIMFVLPESYESLQILIDESLISEKSMIA